MVTSPIRKTENLLMIPHGLKRGQAALSHTIASWLIKAIKKAYIAQQLPIAGGLKSHSIRAVVTS